MIDVDAETLAEASRRYTRLRRRFRRSLLGMIALLVILAPFMRALQPRLGPVAQGVLALLILVHLACAAVGAFTWPSLLNFGCPRCGGRFLLSWTSSWPTKSCKHCGLELG